MRGSGSWGMQWVDVRAVEDAHSLAPLLYALVLVGQGPGRSGHDLCHSEFPHSRACDVPGHASAGHALLTQPWMPAYFQFASRPLPLFVIARLNDVIIGVAEINCVWGEPAGAE